MSDPYTDRRDRNARTYADRNAEHASIRDRISSELASLGFTLDPSGLPSCDLCGSLIAPSRVRLHRTRCTEET